MHTTITMEEYHLKLDNDHRADSTNNKDGRWQPTPEQSFEKLESEDARSKTIEYYRLCTAVGCLVIIKKGRSYSCNTWTVDQEGDEGFTHMAQPAFLDENTNTAVVTGAWLKGEIVNREIVETYYASCEEWKKSKYLLIFYGNRVDSCLIECDTGDLITGKKAKKIFRKISKELIQKEFLGAAAALKDRGNEGIILC